MPNKIRRILFFVSVALNSACIFPASHSQIGPLTQLYYPLGITQKPGDPFLYIVSSNFDQRYAAGWISRLDTRVLPEAWPEAPILWQAGELAWNRDVRIPNLGGDWVWDNDGQHAYIVHRGSALLTLLHQDANRGVWSCRGIPTAPPVDLSALKQNVECDSNHLIDLHEPIKSMQNPAALGEYADPAAVLPWPASSTTAQKLLVGFLSGRLLSVLDIAWPQAEQPDIRLNTQIRLSLPSATALLPSLVDANRIWITSNQPFHAESQHQVLDLDLAGSMNARTQIAQVIDIGSAIEVGRIVKLLQLDNRRIVALTRHPDALLLLLAVEKQWQVVDVLSLGESSPVDILRIPTPENAPAEFVVASLTRDELYWISANTTHLQKISRLGLSGQGPIQMTLFYPGGQVSTERVAIAVSTFFDHGLSLVELSRPLALPIWRELGHYSSVNSAEDVGVSPR